MKSPESKEIRHHGAIGASIAAALALFDLAREKWIPKVFEQHHIDSPIATRPTGGDDRHSRGSNARG